MSSATVKWKVLPTPGWLSSQIRPPIRWTSVEEIARPSPVPPNLRVVDPSAWLKASKMCACLFSGMPMPVSVTENCSFVDPACLESSRTAITMRPRSVNLSALPTRLVSTCFSRTGSPTTALGRPGARSVLSSSPFFAACGRQQLHDVGHCAGQAERNRLELQLARLDLREVEDVVEDREQRLRRIAHRAEAVLLIRRQLGVQGHGRHADDPVHRRADLVAHVRQELRFRAVGRLRRFPQGCLGLELTPDYRRLPPHSPPRARRSTYRRSAR